MWYTCSSSLTFSSSWLSFFGGPLALVHMLATMQAVLAATVSRDVRPGLLLLLPPPSTKPIMA